MREGVSLIVPSRFGAAITIYRQLCLRKFSCSRGTHMCVVRLRLPGPKAGGDQGTKSWLTSRATGKNRMAHGGE